MLLHRANFEIPAQLSFQPFAAEWRIANAETVEWEVERIVTLGFPLKEEVIPERPWVRTRIEVPDMKGLENSPGLSLRGIGSPPSFTVLMDRTSIPRDVLLPHENHRRTPDIAGRRFTVLICFRSEFKGSHSDLKPGDTTKNAWFMRDEFLKLRADPKLGWDGSLRDFLNRWGLWEQGAGFTEDWATRSLKGVRRERPGFVLAVPHLLRKEQENYNSSLMESKARSWLRTHPLSLETSDEPPFFFVRRSYCKLAIEATITIDHLAGRRFGICKRCLIYFQKETQHKKDYCSKRCYSWAGVKRLRDKRRKLQEKGGKRDAKG